MIDKHCLIDLQSSHARKAEMMRNNSTYRTTFSLTKMFPVLLLIIQIIGSKGQGAEFYENITIRNVSKYAVIIMNPIATV